jgi:hypothetical protein
LADYYFVHFIGEPLSGVLTIQYATPSLKHAVIIPVLEKRCNLIVLHLPLASLSVFIITVNKKILLPNTFSEILSQLADKGEQLGSKVLLCQVLSHHDPSVLVVQQELHHHGGHQ